jgi:hypothetical protein
MFFLAVIWAKKRFYFDTRADRFSLEIYLDYKYNNHLSIGESIYGTSNKTILPTSSSIYNHTIPFRTVPVANGLRLNETGDFAKTPASVGSGPNLAWFGRCLHVFNDN